MPEIKLKPCPFCGSRKVDFSNIATLHGAKFSVECFNCFAASRLENSKVEAAEAWNTREYHYKEDEQLC